jgi:sulfatase maturation enzyme AslB (radical SAM superfamily)
MTSIPKTHEIRVETSTKCSFHCLMCPRETFQRPRVNMPDALFEKIVATTLEEAPNINTLTFSGFGEFSMDPDWRSKMVLAAKSFPVINILTNLSRFSDDDLEFLLQHVSSIRISLYGLTKETYKKVHRSRNGNPFETIIKQIEWLCDHRKPDQEVILNYLILDENKHETQDWIKFWENKATRIEVWRPHNWVDGKQYRHQCTHLLPTCGRPFHGPIQVQVDGTVNVCCFDFNGKMVVGDLNHQTLEEIYGGDEMKRIRDLHAAGKTDELELCRVCDQRMCNECKAAFMHYSSAMSPQERVAVTSTAFETLNR